MQTLAAAARPPPRRLTAEEYFALPETNLPAQLLGGLHTMAPAPSTRHQRVVRRVFRVLDRYAETHPDAEVFVSPTDVRLGPDTVVQPDLLLVWRGGAAKVFERAVEGPPDLVVEVLSPTSRHNDLVVKPALYAETGVREYWIVDPDRPAVAVYRRPAEGGEGWDLPLLFGPGQRFTSPVLPGLTIRARNLLEVPPAAS